MPFEPPRRACRRSDSATTRPVLPADQRHAVHVWIAPRPGIRLPEPSSIRWATMRKGDHGCTQHSSTRCRGDSDLRGKTRRRGRQSGHSRNYPHGRRGARATRQRRSGLVARLLIVQDSPGVPRWAHRGRAGAYERLLNVPPRRVRRPGRPVSGGRSGAFRRSLDGGRTWATASSIAGLTALPERRHTMFGGLLTAWPVVDRQFGVS